MHLLIIRHAVAEEKEAWAATGEPDERRPLTPDGRKKMRRAARGLRRLVPELSLLGASPLTRAAQTADIVAAVYGDLEPVTVGALTPERAPADFLSWLRDAAPGHDVIAAVGHEPHLSGLVSWLLTGHASPALVELRKGAACLLRFDDDAPQKGKARLEWLLQPRQLRRLDDR
jgi:phosphohistidine phosphatase